MLWLYDCICMILKATSESEVVENNNHVPEKFTEFDNQRKMEAFFLILIDWTTCWLPMVFFYIQCRSLFQMQSYSSCQHLFIVYWQDKKGC